MATYLELCQAVARDSGTVPTIGDPQTTVNQTGRLSRICQWTADAWRDIQRSRSDWRWMRSDFSGETVVDVQSYDAAAMGIATRFGGWMTRGPRGDNMFSIYKTSEGKVEEGLLTVISWDDMRRIAMVGSITTTRGRPIYVAIDEDDQLAFYPTPDAAYTVRGRYRKAPQELALDSDVPEMPEEFHDAIRYRALMFMSLYDEAMNQMPGFGQQYAEVRDMLIRSQTPRVDVGPPLA